MALNINNKKSQQILPEVEFNITANGLTISASKRISTPRFVPFDHAGRCRECKGSEVEIDFVVTKEGVTCYCTRIKAHTFIPFDIIYDLPGHCFFKIKNKGRVFNIQHGVPPCATIPVLQKVQPEKNENLHPIESLSSPPAKKIKQEDKSSKDIKEEEKFENILQEFFDNIDTTTTTATSTPKKMIEIQNVVGQEEEVKEREKRSTSEPLPFIENIDDNSPLSFRFKDAVNSQSF